MTTSMTNTQIEKMDKKELAKVCKARGIKHGKLSLMQQREALKKLVVETAPVVTETTTSESAPVVKAKKEKVKGPREGSKMEKAVAIFTENKGKARKDIIQLFQSEAGLTAAGSNTYYALIKKNQK